MFKRLKKMWALSKKDPKALSVLENLTEEQLKAVPEEGDGKAVFFGEGSDEELKKQNLGDQGLTAWYRRIQDL